MTEQQRRTRRRIRRIAPTVVFCAIMAAVLIVCVCALIDAPKRDTRQMAQEADAATAITEKPSAITKKPDAITSAPSSKTETVERETQQPEQEQTPTEEISRYAELNISTDDVEILAALVYHEARGECFEGQVAVIEVVLNRCLSPEFPDTVEGVVFQKYGDVWQFSPAPYLWTAEPTQTQYDAVYTAMESTDYILPVETVFFSTTAYNDNIVAVIGNHTFCSIKEVTP